MIGELITSQPLKRGTKRARFAWLPVLCVEGHGRSATRAGWYWLKPVVETATSSTEWVAYRADNSAARPLPDIVVTLASFAALAALTALTAMVIGPVVIRAIGLPE